jgi:transposase InsO family protein
MDFLTVPNTTFSLPYCFFIIGHDRRRILHFNVTYHPTSTWIAQQLRDAFPFEPAAKFLILDHDAEYGTEVPAAIRGMDIAPIRIAIGCPWQNGVAERWVESCRRDLLDHIIAVDEGHLKDLADYIRYNHDRTHLGLSKEPPAGRLRFSGTGVDSFSSATRGLTPSL